MTVYCVLCKKESIPGDRSRSFHKFPDDDGLRRIWMDFVGINSVKKYMKLCSDHFHKNAYVELNEYTHKRSLLKTAVPCKLVGADKVQSERTLVIKDQAQLILQKQQACGSSVGVNSIENILPSVKNNLHLNTIRAVGESKQESDESLSCQVLNSSVAVDFFTSNNLSKSCSANISQNSSSSQVFQEQTIQHTVFCNRKVNDNRTNLKRSMPLCDITDVSPSKRVYSNNESGPTSLNTNCNKSQPNATFATLKMSLPGTNCLQNSDVSPSKKLCPSKVFEASPSTNVSNKVESNEAYMNTLRHMPYIDVSNIPPTKRFRFYDGPQPIHMSRDDFATDEAWSRFLKFIIYKNRQLDACRKKNQRENKKIENNKELGSKLREENETAAAE